MGVERTSRTDPLRIDAIAAGATRGLIGLTICPGKHDPHALTGAWARDLHADLLAIRDWGATALVTLIEAHEFELLRVPDLGERARDVGLDWHHLPIKDVSVPDERFEGGWREAGPGILARLREGERIVVHCRGGLGRSGLVAARMLVDLGVKPRDAVNRVRAARRGAIETVEQERYVLLQERTER
jgi:ADP-ribosyl-[dinitrogen reductase] hydrolase